MEEQGFSLSMEWALRANPAFPRTALCMLNQKSEEEQRSAGKWPHMGDHLRTDPACLPSWNQPCLEPFQSDQCQGAALPCTFRDCLREEDVGAAQCQFKLLTTCGILVKKKSEVSSWGMCGFYCQEHSRLSVLINSFSMRLRITLLTISCCCYTSCAISLDTKNTPD
jgi:hypothetical protein